LQPIVLSFHSNLPAALAPTTYLCKTRNQIQCVLSRPPPNHTHTHTNIRKHARTHLDTTVCFFSSRTNAPSSTAALLLLPALPLLPLLLLSERGVRYTGPSMPNFGTNTMRPFALTCEDYRCRRRARFLNGQPSMPYFGTNTMRPFALTCDD
jgi:hypothetical protein